MNTNETKYKIGSIYFAIFGVIVLCLGVAEILVGLTGQGMTEEGFTWGILGMSGEYLLWTGLILFFAGAFYISSAKNFADIHQQAKAVMASVMIWIIAGMNILGMILGSIPGPEDGPWFNTAEDFLATYAGPYIPSLFLLPFSLVVIYYIRLRRRG